MSLGLAGPAAVLLVPCMLRSKPLTASVHVSRRYNFAKEECVFNYEHTRGSLKLGALYSVKVSMHPPVVSCVCWLVRGVSRTGECHVRFHAGSKPHPEH